MTTHRFKLISITVLLVAATGAQARQPAPDAHNAHNARNALDWAGTYMGTLPSASGGGYRTVLILRGNGRYTLMQDIEHQGKQQALQSNGRFRWDKSGSAVTLGGKDDAQRFFVSEGFVELRGDAPPSPEMRKHYQLTRMQSYPGQGEELLIHPATVKPGQPRKGWTSFDGVWNMLHPTQAGHKSLAARFELNCAAREYRMPTIAYYSQPYQRGQRIDSAHHNDHDIPVTKEDKVMTQVLHDHCPR